MSFPRELVQNDVRLSRDPMRVLVRFVEPIDEETVERIERKFDLRSESARQSERRTRRRREGRENDNEDDEGRSGRTRDVAGVNDSDRFRYFGAAGGEPLDDDLLGELQAMDDVASLSAVFYHEEFAEGLWSHAAAYSDRLFVEVGDVDPRELDERLADEFDLEVDEERSEYLGDYRLYHLTDDDDFEDRETAYDVRERIAEFDWHGVGRVDFDWRPMRSFAQATHPNDSYYPDQDHHSLLGSPDAWDDTRGAGVTVGVVDLGCELTHPDLQTRYANDGFHGGDPSKTGEPVLAQGLPHSHGTHVAGAIAATFDNSTGIAGVAGECSLVPAAVESLGDVAAAITRLVSEGVDVINVGLGFLVFGSPTTGWHGPVDTALGTAAANGVVVVAPTGNDDNAAGGVLYPASHPAVIAVGSSSKTDERCDSVEWGFDGSYPFGSNYGDEVDLVAPGEDVLTTDITGPGDALDSPAAPDAEDYVNPSASDASNYVLANGTSVSAGLVSGTAALLKSEFSGLSAEDVRAILDSTCDKLSSYSFGISKPYGQWNDEVGYGRLNVRKAVQDAVSVAPLASNLNFGVVQKNETKTEDVEFGVQSYVEVQFTVTGPTTTSGPGQFSIPSGTFSSGVGSFDPSTNTVTFPSTGGSSPMPPYAVPVEFTGTGVDEETTGEVEFDCVQTGETFAVDLTAFTVHQPSAVVLVLDESGSMQNDSGVDHPDSGADQTRMEKLHEAAGMFVGLLSPLDAIGLVAFSTNVRTPYGVASGVGHQSNVATEARALTPRNLTAIGDGIEEAITLLQQPSLNSYGTKAICVFSDGCQNAGTPLTSVSVPPDIDLYAVGMGSPGEVCSAELKQIVKGDGYVLVTDELGSGDVYTLQKYFQQIFAGVAAKDIVVDPEGRLRPGRELRVPFAVTDADRELDAILVAPPSVFNLTLETPDGTVLSPTQFPPIPGSAYRIRQEVTVFHVDLSNAVEDEDAIPGRWHAVLDIDEQRYERYLQEIEGDGRSYETVRRYGVRYALSVQGRSDIHLNATLAQDSYDVGSQMFLRAVVTENGRPIGRDVTVNATVGLPDGGQKFVELDPVNDEPGVFEYDTRAKMHGVYTVRLVAEGETRAGHRFTREHVVNGLSFVPDERSYDERRRDDYVDNRDDRDDGDDGRNIDTGLGGGFGGGILGGGVGGGRVSVPGLGGLSPVVPDPRLLRNPRFVEGLVAISDAMREVEREDEDKDGADR